MKKLPAPPLRAAAGDSGASFEVALDASAAALGQAMHRLLEWAVAGEALAPTHVRAVASAFSLDTAQVQAAALLAQRIRAGAGAWVWDETVVDWHGNEVALVHEGEQLRIDRLVRRRDSGVWWVLDYKSAGRPERDATLVAQLRRYVAAVRGADPAAQVRAAFLTGQGEMIDLELQ